MKVISFILPIAATTLVSIATATTAFAQKTDPQTAPLPSAPVVLKIVRNLSIKRPEIESMLGTPFAVKTDEERGYELASYKAKGVTAISIFYFARGGGLPKDTPFPIQVSFPAGTTVTKAIKIIGFDPRKVTPGRVRKDLSGDRFILNHHCPGFDVYWFEAGTKYPDGTPKNSVNTDPLIQFDIKSE